MSECMKLSVLAAAALLALAGCAGSNERSGDNTGGHTLVADLRAAGAPCREQGFKQKAALDDCLTPRERSVWAKDEPATLDVYDRFARQRADIARQYDSGAINDTDYTAKLDQLQTSTRHELNRRREQSANGQ